VTGVDDGVGAYRQLRAEAVRATVVTVQDRIAARFPDRNLRHVAGEVAGAVEARMTRPVAPWYGLALAASRVAIVVLAVVLSVGVGMLFRTAATTTAPESVWAWIQIGESAINDIVFAGIAIFFFWHLPGRVQRRYDLAALHTLRSLAHVIDMHQLTKDPERLRADFEPTERSIDLGMTAAQLGNYLDYCSELLSLVSKTAALYGEDTADPAILTTVAGIEDLTTGMSRKIWQKIALLPS
jgi:hypothetical protein